MEADNQITPESISVQLERIFQSSEFRASDKQRKFLKFVIDETLEGRSSQLKGFTIAISVYGRTENFDPQVDPIVRVEAGRLRRALEHYYFTEGKNDPVRIEIPKGGYVPIFQVTRKSSFEAETPPSKQESGLSTEPSIAVMPLVNMTEDKGQDYFVDGLTEELTVELARYQEFKVIAFQSTVQYKDRNIDPKEIGNDLGVRFLLAGSVRKGSESVKVTIRLFDTYTAEEIWGNNYILDQTPSDLIAIQEKIAHRVIGAIADHYGLVERRLSKESRKKAPSDLKAYDAILLFYQYERELTLDAFDRTLSALEQAVKLDPEYGLAWSMLGHLYADNYALAFHQMEAPLEKALAFAQKGLALVPESQFAWDALSLIYFHQGDREAFLKHVEQTISLNPNAPYIIGVAGWHMTLFGEWERGLALLKRGIELNPFHPSWFHLAFFVDFYRRGKYEDAFAEAIKFNFPELYLDPMMRAVALAQMGKLEEAKTAVDQLLKLKPDFANRGRWLINRYVKVDALIDQIMDGLRRAGLADIK